MNNVFIYWNGYDYKLIKLLRNIIYLHANSGNGYKVHFVNPTNITNYIYNIPPYFYNLHPAHQADFVRVNVICDYGGIWLDSDVIVMESLDLLFDMINKKDGFFIKQNNDEIYNGVFGSKPHTKLMIMWKNKINIILDEKWQHLQWCDIGNTLLQKEYETSNLFNNYHIFNGLDTMYPINWDKCISEYLYKPYNNYKNIIRKFQPIIILVNSVYKELEYYPEKEILNGKRPINYFINKSLNSKPNIKKNNNFCKYITGLFILIIVFLYNMV